jgi:CD109 antigen
MRYKLLVSGILAIIMLLTMLPSCAPPEPADGYAIVIPETLQAGSQQAVSVTLFQGDRTVSGKVELTLFQGSDEILTVEKDVPGKGTISFAVPDIPEGEYGIRIKGNNFEDEATIKIERNFLIFVETDKPIYKPGQTIRMRAFTLDAELLPLSENVIIEVQDAKGIKIFRKEVLTDDYGIATLDLPISTEPNLGVWKITAESSKGKTELDVRVEEYVLPKYEVKIDLPKQWYLVNEEITGVITSEYSFGKPVVGDLEIKASRYVGVWEEYATYNVAIDGEAEFTIPGPGYLAGVPAAGGQGNVILDVVVTEKSTGYEEKTSALLTVADSPVNIQIIPSGTTFKPELPFGILIVTETPDNQLIDTEVEVNVKYFNNDFEIFDTDEQTVNTVNGKVMLEITPPEESAALSIVVTTPQAYAERALEASYSPSGNFIHVEQISQGTPELGAEIKFKVYSTREAANFYYEVVSRGKMVFTSYSTDDEISFTTTPLMAPVSRLLVYQILPNSEVAADYLPFNVDSEYPHEVTVEFDTSEVKPGDEVDININTDGQARVGIAAVDRSVFILAENRLNLQQVFDELEKLYMEPRAELHEVTIIQSITNPGASDVFQDAGVILLTNKKLPDGKEYENENVFPGRGGWDIGFGVPEAAMDGKTPAPTTVPAPTITVEIPPAAPGEHGLAEVQRVRQFFPETWLWQDVYTDNNGNATLKVDVPDTITTWMLRAVAISREYGLGVAESQLVTFQPFFLTIDLPYSAIRGEEFPVKIAIYNYLDEPQSVQVDIEVADWFNLMDQSTKTLEIGPNDIGGTQFMISPKQLGQNGVRITARSTEAADAVIKNIIIEPEGVSREMIENLILTAGSTQETDTDIPVIAIDGSGRAYLTVTSSYLTQTIEGLEGLLQMPFGCGEQNMIVFAPDVFITRYLEASGQLKPEIMAKAEMLMLTGYQRQLTYRHNDGSFSAFGESDPEGSLWLTAFVLKSFAQAEDLIYIDGDILDEARDWIISHQKSDGSFEPVGFIHHQDMMEGISGETALTAYVAIALMEAGDTIGSAKAVSYLETQLDDIDRAYTMTLVTYALEKGNSPLREQAYEKMMSMAKEDENGLYWGDDIEPLPLEEEEMMPGRSPHMTNTPAIEATGYASLAMVEHGDALNASRAAKWLISKRNALGGYGSTQDTVVALEALTTFSTGARADVNLDIEVKSSNGTTHLSLTQENFDVLQIVEIPVNDVVEIKTEGNGEAIAQVVKRFNLPEAGTTEEDILKIDVTYDATEVSVNDLLTVSVHLSFNPPIPMEAGMTVLDISIPTGFAPVTESIAELVEQNENFKRYEIAGRKVIFYIENLLPGDTLDFTFQAVAVYPVKARGVSSQAYAYYQPEITGETLGTDIVVIE